MNNEHENWVRYHAVLLAHTINRFGNSDKILMDAAKIVKFILQKPDCKVIAIKNTTESGDA